MACAVQTFRQQAVWRDNESLWRHEAYLREPSLLALRALAAEYAVRAEREVDPDRRREWAAKARHEARRGIEREAALAGGRPTT
jgi:hypothetical protein